MNAPDHEAPQGDASEISAEAGQVLMDGPDGVAVALSPDAAEETAHRLLAAAAAARTQSAGEVD